MADGAPTSKLPEPLTADPGDELGNDTETPLPPAPPERVDTDG